MDIPTPSPHHLRPGLPGYLIRLAPLGFVPHRQARSSWTPSPPVVPPGLQDFTPTPGVPPTSPGLKIDSISRSLTLGRKIYLETYPSGYGRFRPNKNGEHSSCWCYRGGWHQSYPALIPLAPYTREKPLQYKGTWGSPIALASIVEFSHLLRPVGPGALSQSPSPGSSSHCPYRSKAWWAVTSPTT